MAVRIRLNSRQWRIINMRTLLICFTSLMASAVLAGDMRILDAHSHHEQEYASIFSCTDALTAMDAAGVDRILLTSYGNKSTLSCFEQAPERVIPFYSVYGSLSDKQNWMHQPGLVERARGALETGMYSGIGEFHIFAEEIDSSVLQGLVEVARDFDLPLLLHGDAAVVDRVFEIHPGAKVLWAHLGTRPEIELLDKMLRRYPDGLYIDTSVRDSFLLGNTIVNGPRRDSLLPEWQAFFIQHQDRVLVAVDTYSLNRWKGYAEVVTEIRKWLAQLPMPVAQKLAWKNGEALFGTTN